MRAESGGADGDFEVPGMAKTHLGRGSAERAETRHGRSTRVMMYPALRRFCMQ
jgi:hypothetical protein